MAVSVDIRHNLKEITSEINKIAPKVIKPALRSTLNKILTTVTATAAREIKQEFKKLKISEIKQKHLKKHKADFTNLAASLTAKGSRIPIIKVDPNAKQTGTGVRYRSGGKSSIIPGAFIARMPSGHKGVYKRKGKARLPIKELASVSVPVVFNKKTGILERVVNTKIEAVFMREVNFRLRKQGLQIV